MALHSVALISFFLSLGKAGVSNFASLLPLLVLISKAAEAWMSLIQNNLEYRFSFFKFLVFILTTIRLILMILTVKKGPLISFLVKILFVLCNLLST